MGRSPYSHTALATLNTLPRSQEPGARSQEPGARSQEPGARSVFGLSRPWLVAGSTLIASALVLSHEEQLERLAIAVPEAVETAVIGGDPCYDRMLDSARFRRRYRAALGVDDHRDLVVLTSTWSSNSLLGAGPDLIRRLLAELPIDSFQCALVAHPNIWYGHGPGQLRTWLADCLRAGLILIPPDAGWQAAVLAADLVIGDHGSGATYAAAVGRPVLLASFPEHEVVPGTAVASLGRIAPRLQPGRSLRPQVEHAISGHVPGRYAEVTRLVSAVPGESPQRIRRLCYELMRLPEPTTEPGLRPLSTVGLTPRSAPPAAMLVSGEWLNDMAALRLQRTPVDTGVLAVDLPAGATTHSVVHHAHPARALRRTADVVFGMSDDAAGAAGSWLREVLAEHPACALAALVSDRSCQVRSRTGEEAELAADEPDALDASVLASVAYLVLDGRLSRIEVEIGGRSHRITVRRPRAVIPRARRSDD